MRDPMQFERTVLPSGLTVYYQQRTRSWFKCKLVVGVGWRHDPPGKPGMSHLLEHFVSSGTIPGVPAKGMTALETWVGDQGFDAFSFGENYMDATTYAGGASVRAMRRFFRFMAAVVRHPGLDGDIEKDKADVRAERTDRSPGPEDERRIRRSVFRGQRLAEVDAYPPDRFLDRITVEDLVAMHRRYYRCQNMRLVVIGGFDPQKLFRALNRAFGNDLDSFESLPLSEPLVFSQPSPGAYTDRNKTETSTKSKRLSYIWHVPRHDGVLLTVIRDCIEAELYDRLRERISVTYEVSASVESYADHNSIEIDTTVATGKVASARRIIVEILAKTDWIAETVIRVKKKLKNDARFFDSSLGEIVDDAAVSLVAGAEPRFKHETARLIQEVHIRDMRDFIRKYMTPEMAFRTTKEYV